MESRLRVLFLALVVSGMSGCAATKNLFGMGEDQRASPPAEAPTPEQVIDPQVERREVREPEIDTEDFELGVFAGILSIEDFGSDVVYGARLAYHVTEGLFVELAGGRADTEPTSYERLSGAAVGTVPTDVNIAIQSSAYPLASTTTMFAAASARAGRPSATIPVSAGSTPFIGTITRASGLLPRRPRNRGARLRWNFASVARTARGVAT